MTAWFILSVLEKNWQHRNLFLTAEMNFDFGFHVVNFRELYHGLSNILKIYCQLFFFFFSFLHCQIYREMQYTSLKCHTNLSYLIPPPQTLDEANRDGAGMSVSEVSSLALQSSSTSSSVLTFLIFLLKFSVQMSSEKKERKPFEAS